MSKKNASHANMLSLKTKVLLVVGCPLLVIIICSVVIYFSAQGLVTEGTYNFDENKPIYVFGETLDAKMSENAMTELSFEVINDKTKADVVNSVTFEDFNADSNNESVKSLISFCIDKSVSKKLSDMYPSGSYGYGENPEVTKNLGLFDEYLLSVAKENRIVFSCETDTENLNYKFTAEYPVSDTVPCLNEDKTVLSQFADTCKDMFTVQNSEIKLLSATAQLNADMINGKTSFIGVTRKYAVSAELNFCGDYKQLGTVKVSFVYVAEKRIDILWAGIDIVQDVITLHGNGYDVLSVEVNAAEDTADDEVELTFSSSDTNILTVDENGQIEAVNVSTQPVTVTATLKYLGNTYTDTCKVYVINEVDGISVSPKEISIKTGETAVIEATLDPSNATINGVIWLSDDEKIAIVENGTVTGVAAGETKIVAVSEDGHFMAACNVTVTNGEVSANG